MRVGSRFLSERAALTFPDKRLGVNVLGNPFDCGGYQFLSVAENLQIHFAATVRNDNRSPPGLNFTENTQRRISNEKGDDLFAGTDVRDEHGCICTAGQHGVAGNVGTDSVGPDGGEGAVEDAEGYR